MNQETLKRAIELEGEIESINAAIKLLPSLDLALVFRMHTERNSKAEVARFFDKFKSDVEVMLNGKLNERKSEMDAL